ncbi:MAG TPA: hypothetical protein DDW54_04190 [Clostridiales bacterium]|nr:hypothetical protein [Clostridiales bacterium]
MFINKKQEVRTIRRFRKAAAIFLIAGIVGLCSLFVACSAENNNQGVPDDGSSTDISISDGGGETNQTGSDESNTGGKESETDTSQTESGDTSSGAEEGDSDFTPWVK